MGELIACAGVVVDSYLVLPRASGLPVLAFDALALLHKEGEDAVDLFVVV